MIVPTKAAKAFDKLLDEHDAIGLQGIAKKIGVSVSSVYNYRSGRAEPPLDIAFRIEELYKIPARDWLSK